MQDCSTNQGAKTNQIRISNRYVGEVKNDNFEKKIQFSKHSLHKPPALALSVESLQQAEQFGAREIYITDIESGRVYSCTIDHFKSHAFPIQRGGFEPQLALILEQFDVSSPLVISSCMPKRGEIRFKPGNGKRIRNPRGIPLVSPRQLMLKGLS